MSSIPKILSQSLKLPAKNFAVILPILLLSTFSTSIISYFFSSPPLFTNLITSITSLNPRNPKHATVVSDTIKNVKDLQVAFLFIVSFVCYSLISIATVHVFSSSYSDSANTSTVTEFLYRFCTIRLKGPLLTSIYVVLLNLGYRFTLVSSVGAAIYVAGVSKFLMGGASLLAVLGLLLGLYLSMVWSVSLVVSVVEENCYGFQAMKKAVDIIRGRWRQGVSIIFIVPVRSSVISVFREPVQAHLDIGIFFYIVAAVVVVGMYERAVGTVFYFDCKKSASVEEALMEVGNVVLIL